MSTIQISRFHISYNMLFERLWDPFKITFDSFESEINSILDSMVRQFLFTNRDKYLC